MSLRNPLIMSLVVPLSGSGIKEPGAPAETLASFTIGSATGSAAGVGLGMHKDVAWAVQGDITPLNYGGSDMLGLNVNTDSDTIVLYFVGGTQPFGNYVVLNFGFTGGTYTLPWDAGESRYKRVDASLAGSMWTFFNANYATAVPLVITPQSGAAGGQTVNTLTTGASGVDVGYKDGQYGDLAPQLVKGQTAIALYTRTDDGDLILRILGDQPQGLFLSMEINGVVYTSASASHAVGATYTRWRWNGVYPSISAPGSYSVRFV